jgi:hypothetical protein
VLFFSGVVESASGVPPVTSPLHLWREKGLFWRESVAGMNAGMRGMPGHPCVRVANRAKIGSIDRAKWRGIARQLTAQHPADEARKHIAATIHFQ